MLESRRYQAFSLFALIQLYGICFSADVVIRSVDETVGFDDWRSIRGTNSPFVEFNDELYFVAAEGSRNQVYKTDGNGIVRATDFAEKLSFSNFTVVDEHMYFLAANTPVSMGRTLYRTDGRGIERADDLLPPGGYSAESLYQIEDELVIVGAGELGVSFTRTDGIRATTITSAELKSVPDLHTSFVLDGKLHFSATLDGLYTFDGASLARTSDRFQIPLFPSVVYHIGDRVVFNSDLDDDDPSASQWSLSSFDGSDVSDLSILAEDWVLVPVGEHLYFGGRQERGLPTDGLYRTDGMTVEFVTDVDPFFDAGGFREYGPPAVNDGWFYFSDSDWQDPSVYRTNGVETEFVANGINVTGGVTVGGTFFLVDSGEYLFKLNEDGNLVEENPIQIYGSQSVEFAGLAFFPNRIDLKISDGSKTSSHPIRFRGTSSLPVAAEFDGELFFIGENEAGVNHLYKATIAGDANEDGNVDFADFVALSANYAQPGGWAQGDFDLNEQVEFADFILLSKNFNNGTEVANVPEPASAITMVMCCCLFNWCRRRRGIPSLDDLA